MGPPVKELTPLLRGAASTDSDLAEAAGAEGDWGRTYLFLFFILTRILIHYDSGAIAAGLGSGCTHGGSHNCAADRDLLADLRLSYAEAGLLVCLVYLGLSVACIFGGVVLERFPSKTVLTAAIALDILCVGAFAASTSKYVSLASRFLIGIAQAFFVMYLPVWVDEYAPAGRATSWMAMTQIGSNLGIILGYVVAGMVTVHTQYSWRAPFWFQVALLLPVLLLFTSLRPQAMDVSAARGGKGTGGLGGGRAPTSALAEFPAVLGSPVFLLTSGVLPGPPPPASGGSCRVPRIQAR